MTQELDQEKNDHLGLRDPDQPTRAATESYQVTCMSEFTPIERWMIRGACGLLPSGADDD